VPVAGTGYTTLLIIGISDVLLHSVVARWSSFSDVRCIPARLQGHAPGETAYQADHRQHAQPSAHRRKSVRRKVAKAHSTRYDTLSSYCILALRKICCAQLSYSLVPTLYVFVFFIFRACIPRAQNTKNDTSDRYSVELHIRDKQTTDKKTCPFVFLTASEVTYIVFVCSSLRWSLTLIASSFVILKQARRVTSRSVMTGQLVSCRDEWNSGLNRCC